MCEAPVIITIIFNSQKEIVCEFIKRKLRSYNINVNQGLKNSKKDISDNSDYSDKISKNIFNSMRDV